ncbi:deaminase [Paenibacillus sp. Leaf72]|uniref:deaminase n=1 Tax=Paenibacillus sp. Leaf72 TaxID=1736234 RepID=UPI0006F5F812|nr:deaminase [Paenibacillus sp. Leaf72]KQO18316.1 hypothetical protein ASF12_06755 [Paenibacillus sp. Leaf72]
MVYAVKLFAVNFWRDNWNGRAGNHMLQLENKRFIADNGLTLYTTCEPCPMCTGTIVLSMIKKVLNICKRVNCKTHR